MPAPVMTPAIPASHPFVGKKVWVPRMSDGSARIFAAALRSLGLDASPIPPSDPATLELGALHSSGDECYPLKITLGDCLKILSQPACDPGRTAFFLATGQGPCRFGQYIQLMQTEFAKIGCQGVTILAPSCESGYSDLGPGAGLFVRSAWRALLAGDLLLKYLLKIRPYETSAGDADAAHDAAVEDACRCLETPWPGARVQLARLRESLLRARFRFRGVPVRFDPDRLLIGAVGEIFCRLNSFSNQEFVRHLERAGAEVWISDISEWIWYVNWDEQRMLRLNGGRFSAPALRARLRAFFQKRDEHALRSLFAEDFRGYEEPHASEILRSAAPYLPPDGALGEMTVNTGRSICLARKGVDGIADISPFTCMNGIVCEAVYPKVSKDLFGIPIRNFYCDETRAGPGRDIGIFLELARGYRSRKSRPRPRPFFPAPGKFQA